MTPQRAIEIIGTEIKCVLRATQNQCDRDCGKCDLVMDSEEILAAYGLAIVVLGVMNIEIGDDDNEID